MGLFQLSNGCTFEEEGLEAKCLKVLVGRQRLNDDGTLGEVIMGIPDEFKKSSDRRIEKEVSLRNSDTLERYQAIDTYLLAENKEYIDYPLVEYYDGEFAINVKVEQKAEVTIQLEEWTKRIYFDWKGNITFYDFVRYLEDNIEEDFINGKLRQQGCVYIENYKEMFEDGPYLLKMYNNEGDTLDAYLRGKQLLSSIVSVRLVDFKMEIID